MSGASERPKGAERRRAPRFRPEEIAVEVAVVGARLLTIGAYGVMIEAPIPLSPDSNLRLQLLVGGHRGPVDGRVRHCTARTEGRQRLWNVGVEFEAMSSEDRARLTSALVPKRARS